MATDTLSFATLKSQFAKKTALAPVYLLHGEEGFFIDHLLKLAEQMVPEQDRDFNLYMMYAPQVEGDTVIDACRRYPMMADRQVVILKEAQEVSATYFKGLAEYVKSPTPSTILIIGSRGAKVKSTELVNAIKKSGGVVFESKKLSDSQVAGAITDFVKARSLSIESKALEMLRDFVGSDLSRLYNEVEKLTVTLGAGAMVTPEAIERNIGISKDYNNFELVAAIANRNNGKAMAIIDHFKHDPKKNPYPVILSVLYNFFSNLLIAQYTPDKSERSLLGALGLKWSVQLKDVNAGLRNYHPAQVVQILSALRQYDAQSKGNGSRMDAYDLLGDLIYHILTATGRNL